MEFAVPLCSGIPFRLKAGLQTLALSAWALAAADAELKFVRPSSAYAEAETQCMVSGAFEGKEALRVQWLLSLEKTVLARGETEAAVTANGKAAQFTLKPPALERAVTLRLDVEISGKRASGELRVYPAAWAKELAAAHSAQKKVGVFDSGSFAERLEKLGVGVEACPTALGLSAFKGDVLLVSPAEAAAGWDLAARLETRVQAGLTVVVFAPERLKFAGHEEAVTTERCSAALKSATDSALDDKLFNGMWTDRSLRVPKESGLVALVETEDEAHNPVLAECVSGSGRWIVVATDPTERAAAEPAVLNLLWSLLDYSSARKGSKKE